MNGVDMIAAERARQSEVEGFTKDHDRHHEVGDILRAALCYVADLVNGAEFPDEDGVLKELPEIDVRAFWPWQTHSWKPTADRPVRQLVKAGALIAAEIDRRLSNVPEESRA